MTDFNEIAERGYSVAFDRIVQDPDNAVHLIAYGLYKKHKRDFAMKGKYQRWSREMRDYRKGITEGEIEDLHLSAKEALHTFAGTALTQALQQRLDDQATKTKELGQETVKLIRKQTQDDMTALRDAVLGRRAFWPNVGASMVATVILGVIMTWAIIAQVFNPLAPVLAELNQFQQQQADPRYAAQAPVDDNIPLPQPAEGFEKGISEEIKGLCRLVLEPEISESCGYPFQ